MSASLKAVKRFGRYEVLDPLGRGAMGVVYRARDPQIGRIVAIKSISLAGLTSEMQSEYSERFRREAEAAGRISHPGIVTIFDIGEEPETHTPYIVMEYVKGKSLEQAGKLAPENALALVRELAEALDCAHTAGVIHRDLKPSNILLTEDGRAKIADFGVAKLNLSELTSCGQILGTPAFMSPEQLNGDPVDGRSDLFSLGVIFYTLITGHRPFQGNSVFTVSFKVVHHEPVSVTDLDLTLSAGVNDVVVRALAKDPAKRYQRGAEMAADIQKLLDRKELGGHKDTGSRSAALQDLLNRPGRTSRNTPKPESTRVALSQIPKNWRTPALLIIACTAIIGALALWHGYGRDAGVATLPPSPPPTTGVQPIRESVAALLQDATPPPGANEPLGATKLPHENAVSSTSTSSLPKPLIKGEKANLVAKRGVEGQSQAALEPKKRSLVSASPSSAKLETVGSVEARSAALQISVEHKFDSADLTVWVDDQPVLREKLDGGSRKKFGPFGHSGTKQSQSVYVTPGTHQLRVHVQSVADDYDESDSLSADFLKNGERVLELTFGKTKEMKLSLK